MIGLRWTGADSLKEAGQGGTPHRLCQYLKCGGFLLTFSAGQEPLAPPSTPRQMHAITDTQNGQSAGQDSGITGRGRLIIHAGGTSRKDKTFDLQMAIGLELCESSGGRNQFAVDMTLTHAAGNQPTVL